MSILEKPYLKLPLHNATQLYNQHIVPRLTTKNKVIAISTAIAISLVYFIQDRLLKPPKHLRHIPYVSLFSTLKSFWNRECFWDRAYKLHLPLIEAENSKGLFLEMSRLGWTVHIANSEDAKRVLLKHEFFPKANIMEGSENSLAGKFVIGPNMVILNGEHWKSQRKIANPAFGRSMPLKLFGKLTQELFKAIESMGEVVNVSDLMQRLTLEAIGKVGFGFDFNAIRDRNSEWVVRYNRIGEGLSDPKYFLFPSLDTTFLWLFPSRQKIHKEMNIFTGMLNNIIQHKKEMIKKGVHNDALEENEKDLLTLMIESGKENNGVLSDKELMSNLSVFFLAGHDTTSSTLSFVIYYLAANQEIQQRAREEVISILGDEPYDVLPTAEDTKQMKYINQIIKETLRINGPAPRIIERAPIEDVILSETFIPKETPITVNIFGIQHTKKYWKNPDIFDPERFAEDGEATRGPEKSMVWLPFGNGARQCIGMNFSLNEQRVVISMLLRKFTWVIPENSLHKNGVIAGGFPNIKPINLDMAFCKRY